MGLSSEKKKKTKIGICCFSAKHAALKSKNKVRIRIMCHLVE